MNSQKQVLEYLFIHNLWNQITDNVMSESCKDAAQKRKRLGNIGIPLMDELKSNFGYYINENGIRNYVILHCRGNQLISMPKVNEILGFTFKRLDKQELKELFGLEYGIVNPLVSIKHRNIIQLFDETVLEKYLPPFTMMTNAGHFELGLEFKPIEMVNVISKAKIEDIILDETKPRLKVHKVGILTGNSPESGIMLWESMNASIREKLGNNFLGDISFPRVFMESIPEMGLSMELELREDDIKRIVLDSVENLCNQGVTVLAVACNTTQYFERDIQQICKRYNVIFVSMEKCIQDYLELNGIKEFDFLGIRYVTDFNRWSAFKSLSEKYSIHLPTSENLERINELAFEVKRKNISAKGINKLRDLINNATANKHVIIALTELSILLSNQKNKAKSQKVYIDTLTILSESLADIFVTEINKAYCYP